MASRSSGDARQPDCETTKTDAERLFDEIVKAPAEVVLGGTIDDNEGLHTAVSRALDILGGVDRWVTYRTGGVDAIKVRVQKHVSYGTFTIRDQRASGARTELQKLQEARRDGSLLPRWMLQAYVNPDQSTLLSAAICQTRDCLAMIDRGMYETKHTGANQTGQASFLAIAWWQMEEQGFKLLKPTAQAPSLRRLTGAAANAIFTHESPDRGPDYREVADADASLFDVPSAPAAAPPPLALPTSRPSETPSGVTFACIHCGGPARGFICDTCAHVRAQEEKNDRQNANREQPGWRTCYYCGAPKTPGLGFECDGCLVRLMAGEKLARWDGK